MSGRILIVDSMTTQRIACRADLIAAHYDVDSCASPAEALPRLRAAPPDLVILGLSGDDADEVADFCRALRSDRATAGLSLVIAAGELPPVARLTLLRAGADDILERPVTPAVMQARIRSLLRDREAEADLQPREETRRALGFAEEAEPFAPAGRCVILTDTRPDLMLPALDGLRRRLAGPCVVLGPECDIGSAEGQPVPDLVVIDASRGDGPRGLFRRIADLRARSATRHAGILVIIPPAAPDLAVMTLDLGANDLVTSSVSEAELALRAEALLRRKARNDRLRDTVRNGLVAAVTDPLTGLHNRRYALPQLNRMAGQARQSGQGLAVMVLDIDHFKQINDRHGHAAGDTVLTEIAHRLRDQLRPVDLIARIGGEEFLVAMPDLSAEAATFAAERLRRTVEDRPFGGVPAIAGSRPSNALRVTLSIGVATLDSGPDEDVSGDALYVRADGALYLAKAAGRNTVSLHTTAA